MSPFQRSMSNLSAATQRSPAGRMGLRQIPGLRSHEELVPKAPCSCTLYLYASKFRYGHPFETQVHTIQLYGASRSRFIHELDAGLTFGEFQNHGRHLQWGWDGRPAMSRLPPLYWALTCGNFPEHAIAALQDLNSAKTELVLKTPCTVAI